MANSTETGHAKNVANFEEVVSIALSYGAAYNPSKESIKLSALQALGVNAKSVMDAVNAALPVYSNAVAAREAAFMPFSKFITKVMNALKATDTAVQVDDSAKTLVRKIQGARATAKKTEEEKKALAADGIETKEISASQMSYDSRLENFNKLIQLLSSVPQYAPNEEELKISSLNALYNDLKAKNTAVINASIALGNARIARNKIMYESLTGLCDLMVDVKTYIKSVFGASSPQFKQVSRLTFKAVKA